MPQEASHPERLAYWYLRLNGFLVWENFVIHADTGSNQRTEADLVGVRLMHRLDSLDQPLVDDPRVAKCDVFCNVIFAEVKSSQCALNDPWKRRGHKNVHRLLRAVGCFPDSKVDQAADAIYSRGQYADSQASFRLLAFGNQRSVLPIEGVEQITYHEMIEFIHNRLCSFLAQKASVGNWAPDGQKLRELAGKHSTLEEFDCEVRSVFQVPAVSQERTP